MSPHYLSGLVLVGQPLATNRAVLHCQFQAEQYAVFCALYRKPSSLKEVLSIWLNRNSLKEAMVAFKKWIEFILDAISRDNGICVICFSSYPTVACSMSSQYQPIFCRSQVFLTSVAPAQYCLFMFGSELQMLRF